MARPHAALVELAAGRGLPSVADPWALMRSAREHRMTGLLWTWERDRARAGAEPWRAQLQHEDFLARAWAQRLWTALETVVARLQAIDVEVVAIKGVTTEARWYDRRGERPCDDLDLLIGPADLHRVDEIVETLHPGHPLGPCLAALVGTGRLAALTLAVDGVPVDLHFDLLQLGIPLREPEAMWERTLRFGLPHGGVVRVLDAETALVHLLLNLNKDRFGRLLGYVDIVRILERETVRWDLVDTMVRSEGLEAATYLSLRAVCRTAGLDCPVADGPRGLRTGLWRILWRPAVRLRGAESRAHFLHRQHLLVIIAKGRVRDAVRSWWRLVLPAPALVRYAFPSESGPSLWRITAPRARHIRQRRVRAQLPRRDADLEVAPAPPPEHLPTIDERFVPVVRHAVASVEIDGEAVLLDEETGALCLLSAVATVAWACFDGSSAIGEVASDLAVEFGADLETVRAEVMDLARELAGQGMLEL